MRWHLIKTFDYIYVLDLHGNYKRNEVSPDGSKDENVFDIQVGTSILIAIKNGNQKRGIAVVRRFDVYGKREDKYHFLNQESIKSIKWTSVELTKPNYTFKNIDFINQESYRNFFSVTELFKVFGLPMMTGRDAFSIHSTYHDVVRLINEINNQSVEEIRNIYNCGSDSSNLALLKAITDIKKNKGSKLLIRKVNYRPFDFRYTFYTGVSSGVHSRPQNKVNGHLLFPNVGLLVPRQLAGDNFYHVFITDTIAEFCVISNKTKEQNQLFPLYYYDIKNISPDDGQIEERSPNLNLDIVKQISNKIDLIFTNEKNTNSNTFAPIDIFDYIYAVLHSNTYREKYKEFLKIDFPRIPYPENEDQFRCLAKFGSDLRTIHLMINPTVMDYITAYPVDGTNMIEKIQYIDNTVFINRNQYFEKIPDVIWNFYIGSYQPAKKWLKDRKGCTLTVDDILHYQKIIVALYETNRIMGEIDKFIQY